VIEIRQGHVIDVLRAMEAESVQCCVTSPPYFGLRSYGLPPIEWEPVRYAPMPGLVEVEVAAWSGCLGLEPDPWAYVGHLVAVFREVRRVMREDGCLFLNIGDNYASGKGTCYNPGGGSNSLEAHADRKDASAYPLDRGNKSDLAAVGLKPKDLMMIPARVALALQADGWWVRSAPPWLKKNGMPESVTDRPTTSHEYWFQLTKAARCYYDAEAVRERQSPTSHGGVGANAGDKRRLLQAGGNGTLGQTVHQVGASGRNRRTSDFFFESLDVLITEQAAYLEHLRDVRDDGGMLLDEDGDPLALLFNTKGFSGAHFATFNADLITPMVKCSTSERGACPECGAAWERCVEQRDGEPDSYHGSYFDRGKTGEHQLGRAQAGGRGHSTTTGWRPTCTHYDDRYRSDFPQARKARKRYQRQVTGDWWRRVRQRPGLDKWPTMPCACLDPFGGSGTVGLVCDQLGRDAVLIELSGEYVQMSHDRIYNDAPLFAQVEVTA